MLLSRVNDNVSCLTLCYEQAALMIKVYDVLFLLHFHNEKHSWTTAFVIMTQ